MSFLCIWEYWILFFFALTHENSNQCFSSPKPFLVLNFMPFTKMRELRAQCSCLLNTSEQDAKEHKHDLHEQKKINANNTASEISVEKMCCVKCCENHFRSKLKYFKNQQGVTLHSLWRMRKVQGQKFVFWKTVAKCFFLIKNSIRT